MTKILLLGLQGAGKTVLMRQLSNLCRGVIDNCVATSSTVGMEMDEFEYRGVNYSIKEVGGAMSPVWPKYYASIDVVFFMIDACNEFQLPAAICELAGVLEAKELADSSASVCIIINKGDLSSSMSRLELVETMRLSDLIENGKAANSQRRFGLVGPVSAIQSSTLHCILEWLHNERMLREGGGEGPVNA